MLAQSAIRVDGLGDLRKVLRKVADKEIQKQLKTANKSAAQIVVDAALPNVPVRTGRLKSSVKALGSQKVGRAVAGAARAPHGAAIHWGRKTGNVGSPPGNHPGRNPIPGTPFLWDAAQRRVPQVERQYRDDIMKVVKAVERRFS